MRDDEYVRVAELIRELAAGCGVSAQTLRGAVKARMGQPCGEPGFRLLQELDVRLA